MPSKPCKDCATEDIRRQRPAPYPGPRCYSHWLIERKRRKEDAHENKVQRVYNLEPGQYKKLLELQGGVCYVCRRAKGIARHLSVDHDHKCCNGPTSCGKCLRGLLCRKCNDMFGHARDEPAFFNRAITYLICPPAKELRINGQG